jgi:nucleotide-binding universal stress UspA family protein
MPVLVATNGSSHSEAALRLGTQIARRGCEPLTILTVIKHRADRPPAPADVILARACEIVQPQSLDVRTRVRIGHPATEIVREAEEGNYDLVIVGAKPNRNLVARFLLGSTAVRVVEHAPCPVIVAKGKAGPVQRLLLCDSGAEGPSVVSRFTAQLADLIRGGEEVTILHVMSQMSAGPGVKGKQLRAGVEDLIQEHAPEGELLELDIQALERLGIHARASVRHGLVVDEILEEGRSGDYDLVVIGAYRGEGWRRILLDDLAHKIIVQLDRPVLVVR